MKLHLDSNTVEGTPEELAKYQELLEDKKQPEHEPVQYEEEEDTKGHK